MKREDHVTPSQISGKVYTLSKVQQDKEHKEVSKPLYVPILIFLTILYLLVECAFNARLLDAVGGKATIEEIDTIEFYGRIISGVALALAICGSVVFPYVFRISGNFLDYAWRASICSLFLILFVFYGEKALIDSLADHSTPLERKNCALLSLASAQIKQGNVLVEGIDLNAKTLLSPEGKSFVALFSPLVASMPKGYALIEHEMDSIIRQSISQQLGSAEAFYHGAFASSFTPLQEQFLFYGDAVEKYRKKMAQAEKDAEKHWEEYVAKLQRKRLTPQSVPPKYVKSVRKSVRNSGIPVSNNWKPSDYNGFTQAYINAVTKRLLSTAKKQFREHNLPENFPLTLTSFNAFLNHPVIQKKWKSALHLPTSAVLHNGMTLKDFTSRAFKPLTNTLFTEKKALLCSAVEQFSDNARLEQQGKDAVRSVIVPPIALLFSLLGIIVHICKASFYTMRLFMEKMRYALLANALLFSVLLAIPFFCENAITQTKVYAHVEKKISETSPITAQTMRWIIQTQSFTYPVNNWIHKNILQYVTFGINQTEEKEQT